MARVLILRGRAEAERTAALLRARGHDPLILPMEEAVARDGPPPAGGWAGFAATSANALPALMRHFPADERPLLCVGEGTAEAARSGGFPHVLTGDGRATGLGALAAELAGRTGAPLLYAAGSPRTGTLEAALRARRISFAVWEAYAVHALHPNAHAVQAALADGPPGAVLVLSVGQARACEWLARAVPAIFDENPVMLCLSERIAAALPLFLRENVRISGEPRLFSLFDRLR